VKFQNILPNYFYNWNHSTNWSLSAIIFSRKTTTFESKYLSFKWKFIILLKIKVKVVFHLLEWKMKPLSLVVQNKNQVKNIFSHQKYWIIEDHFQCKSSSLIQQFKNNFLKLRRDENFLQAFWFAQGIFHHCRMLMRLLLWIVI
jgi:hypothetical protein